VQSQCGVTRPVDSSQGENSVVERSCGEVLDGLFVGNGFGRGAA